MYYCYYVPTDLNNLKGKGVMITRKKIVMVNLLTYWRSCENKRL